MKRYLFRIITLVCVKMMIPSFLFAGTVFNANAQKITLVYEQVELHKICLLYTSSLHHSPSYLHFSQPV